MALPQVTRIVAPHLWGWLADAAGGSMRLVRVTTLAGALCWLGMFAGSGFLWICAVILAMSFFLSAALPLVEAATLTHLGEQTGRYGAIRVWGSIGYIAAVVARGLRARSLSVAGAALDRAGVARGHARVLLADPRGRAAARMQPTQQPIARILKRPEVIALIVACALMAVAHGPYYTFYSIHLVDHGYSKGVTGWLWALGVVCEIAIFLWLPRLYAAFSLRAILIASFALAVVRFLLIGWGADSLALLLLAQALHAATLRLVSRRGDRHRAPALPRPAPGARPGDLRQPELRRRRHHRQPRERLRVGAARRGAHVLRPRRPARSRACC